MKVTLVYSSISLTGFNSFGKNYTAAWFSQGFSSISAYAKREGFDVNLIDLRKLKDWDDFEKVLKAEKPDVVATGVMTVDYDYGMKVMNIAKELGCITVIGGVHVTVEPEM
jgi:glycine/serine hydroxymethyltransferase